MSTRNEDALDLAENVLIDQPIEMASWTSHALDEELQKGRGILILPLGSVEPHGPHLPLSTDRLLAEESSRRSVQSLREKGVRAWLAPSLAYAVTEYAQGFCGAISISQPLYEQLLVEISEQYIKAGFDLICWVNHHLEPQQLAAIRNALTKMNEGHQRARVVAPAVVSRRWGRALGHEFKSGACHAGSYEGSMVLVTHPELVKQSIADELPTLEISLSEAIKAGKQGFIDAGMSEAYTGAPSRATKEEGERLYIEHNRMITTEVIEALAERE